MPEVRDADRLRDAYDALNRGDAEAALGALDEGAEWHEVSAMPDAGSYHGRESIARFLATFMESWEAIRQDIEEVVEAGDRVGLFIHLKALGRGSGVVVDRRYAHVWTLRGGRGVRVDAYDDPEAARAALARVAATPQAPATTTDTTNSR